jgi:hypothetical protein
MDSLEPPEPAPGVPQPVKAAQAVKQAFQRWTDNHQHTVVESDDDNSIVEPGEGDSDMEFCSSDEDSDFDDMSDDGTESIQDLEAMIDELGMLISFSSIRTI